MNQPYTLGTLLRQKLGLERTPEAELNDYNSLSLHAHLNNLTANSQKGFQNKRLCIKSSSSDFVRINQILRGWEVLDNRVGYCETPFTMFIFPAGAFFCIRGNPVNLTKLKEFLAPEATSVYGTKHDILEFANLDIFVKGNATPIITRNERDLDGIQYRDKTYNYIGSMQKLSKFLIERFNYPERVRIVD